MIRDPFGGWDWDGIKQLAFMSGFLLLVLTLGAATEGNWSDPYVWAYNLVIAHSALSIGIVMVGIMALWWYEQFNGGMY